jgi:hypothetical protein
MLAGPAICIALLAQALSALQQTPEQRAIAYLAREVPRWSQENNCFSCHNNGDGARALYIAKQRRYSVPDAALAGTTRWLLEPGKWDKNRANPAFSDRKLARIQFAASLVEAFDAGVTRDRSVLVEAAESLLPYQDANGSWHVDTAVEAGSPVTYGSALATYLARRTLERAGASQFTPAIARANQWLLAAKPTSILDTAAVVLAMPRAGYLDVILRAQSSDGGWGPQRHAPAEPFDTAVVLLALHRANEPERTGNAIAHGRAFLIALQQPSGGWPETTRPPGGQTYAQHISTSAWATIALLTTDSERQ